MNFEKVVNNCNSSTVLVWELHLNETIDVGVKSVDLLSGPSW